MPYTTRITRATPSALLFLLDQSGSMADKMAIGPTKAQFVADVLNRTLADLIQNCTRAEGVLNYFDIGVIAYGGDQAYNGFQGTLGSSILNPLPMLEQYPLRIEQRLKKQPDGAGGVVELPINFPVWFEPNANGGTPMCQAITKAAEVLVPWCDAHPDCFPPTVLHVTDGESTDGNPEQLAGQLCQIKTNDGNVLMFNLHVSTADKAEVPFPASEQGLPDLYAQLLFRMSSLLPEHLIQSAAEKGYEVEPGSRGFMFNIREPEHIVAFFNIGTMPRDQQR